MGGHGATGRQLDTAIGGQANLAKFGAAQQQGLQATANQDLGQTNAFYSKLATQGLPFYRQMTDYNRGGVAQAFAPARADIYRRTGMMPNAPSGYRDALINNLNAQQARAFDATQTQAMMANQLAKQQGAAGLQGNTQIAGGQALGYGAEAGQANQSVIGAPRKPGVLGAIGGGINSALNSLKP